jgi:hypothetical protein
MLMPVDSIITDLQSRLSFGVDLLNYNQVCLCSHTFTYTLQSHTQDSHLQPASILTRSHLRVISVSLSHRKRASLTMATM